ncbi:hypothetical protein AQUCO_01600123v1 [Aquilegia coerulea]|uniref:Uncharacterized protein n=1 Tax=Aquilegia coerulea TaxID=218851 RepID=A0A2G5DQ77_AQUCA|nr:hypothetical protein AQUCO_01600123v1 [Aquilegia coerulea]
MASGAAEGLIRCVLDGCLSESGVEIERKPYHRNCSCALHKPKGQCYKVSNGNKKISYPMRRSYSESCLALAESNFASPSSSPSYMLLGVKIKTKLELCREEESD